MPEAEATGSAFWGAAFVGGSDLVSGPLANWEPTALSKKPPPEEPAMEGPFNLTMASRNNIQGSSVTELHQTPKITLQCHLANQKPLLVHAVCCDQPKQHETCLKQRLQGQPFWVQPLSGSQILAQICLRTGTPLRCQKTPLLKRQQWKGQVVRETADRIKMPDGSNIYLHQTPKLNLPCLLHSTGHFSCHDAQMPCEMNNQSSISHA